MDASLRNQLLINGAPRGLRNLYQIPPKAYGTNVDQGVIREEHLLPLQNLEGTGGSENVERGVKQHNRGRDTSESPVFKPGLHIHGDLSTNRPGHFKRWDSEARIGDGHGVEVSNFNFPS